MWQVYGRCNTYTHTHTHNHGNPDTHTNSASNHQKALHFQTLDINNFMRAVICKLKKRFALRIFKIMQNFHFLCKSMKFIKS